MSYGIVGAERVKLQEHSLQIHGAKLWNEIPASLRNKTTSTFKRNLNSHLFLHFLNKTVTF